jgi:hypothetical protein
MSALLSQESPKKRQFIEAVESDDDAVVSLGTKRHKPIILSDDEEEMTKPLPIQVPTPPRVETFSDDDEPGYNRRPRQARPLIIEDEEDEVPPAAPLIADDEAPNATEQHQLDNTEWLQRSLHTLRLYSAPIQADPDPQKEFLALKKQWKYARGMYSVFESLSQVCGLCDQQNVSYLFTITNLINQNELDVASSCIFQFRVGTNNREESSKIIAEDVAAAKAESQAIMKNARSCLRM